MDYENYADIPFIGKGWSFPPSFNKANKQLKMASGNQDIKQSLEILLSTRVGERFIHPDFGCDLRDLLFQPLDTTLENYMSDLIRTAIVLYEPRISIEKITLKQKAMEGLINIEIEYLIRTTNTRSNFVYPFYLKEATNI
ncbi:MAG: GPW/gp25 family protein [Saprospiraceae bacterium]|nr:GPW/gp25 family protein [Saprospiraceae bacterium]